MSTIDHVAFTVTNIHEAVNWYKKQAGAHILHEDESWGLVEISGCKLSLVLPDEHPNHFAIKCKSLTDFPWPMENVDTHRDGSSYIYLRDPYGNAIEWIYYPDEEVSEDSSNNSKSQNSRIAPSEHKTS